MFLIGKSKSNRTWTPLHLAAYFGHKMVVDMLLKNDADPNMVNHTGDTPLHKAAFTSREVLLCIMYFEEMSKIMFLRYFYLNAPKQIFKEMSDIRVDLVKQ